MKPRHIAYIIWTVIALLGVVCIAVPEGGFHIGKHTLRWPTLVEALELQEDSTTNHELAIFTDSLLTECEILETPTTDSILKPDTLPTQSTTQQKPQPVIPEVQITNTDMRAYLDAFYAALDSANAMPVRVVHYGDSQIEEDRITNILREQWQKQYGGGGVGLIPLHQTIPTRSIRQWITMNDNTQNAQGGPKRYLVYGPRSMRLADCDDYGVMGQVAIMDSTLVHGSQDIILHIEPANKQLKRYNYFNRLRFLTNDSAQLMLDSISLPNQLILPDSTTHYQIHLHGNGAIYGISLETDKGIIVDNIPMRGCSGNIFTKIDSAQLADFYRETNTRLIILQFGGNMIPQTENPSTISGYVRTTLRQQVRYIRACAPHASILFIGPSDMSTNIDGQMTTYPLIPYMDRLLRKMAAEEQIAYWSMYDAMGGKDSMLRWVEVGLAGSDYVHFTRAGANKVGKQLYDWLMTYQHQPINSNL